MNAHRTPSRSQPFVAAKRVLVALAVLLIAACDTTYSGREGTIEYPGSGAAPGAVATYVTRDGDTVDGVASRFGVPRDIIIQRNGLKEPYRLRAGTSLVLPGARVVDTTSARPAPPPQIASVPSASPAPAAGRIESTDLPPPGGGPRAPTSAAPPAPADGTSRMAPPTSAAPVPAAAARFDWPVRGRTLQGFGPRAGGQQNDGIDIAAASGTPVKAADGGTVVYAGSEVRGLGNLLLVSHAGGYITAYAHLDKMSVAKGATVKKGQTIGTVGASGGVSEAQLHFEIRHRNKPVDPVGLLPR